MSNTKVIIEVPHRISGFFEIVDQINGNEIKDPEKIGSRGAGFNLTAVGRTAINYKKLEKTEEIECKIYINNKEVNQKAETTCFIFNYIKNLIKTPIKIEIYHNFDLPVGCGYGASGSGALGTIYGLNKILNLNFSNKEKGRIAHIAEIINRTGLGTVCGQLAGGLCILKEPGYPCVYDHVYFPENLSVISGSFGILHTKSVLTDPVLNLKIKQAGRIALKKLIDKPNIKTFMRASIEFVKETNILTILDLIKVKELIDNLNKLNIIGASMNQIGRSIFAICKEQDKNEVIDVFNSFKPKIKVMNFTINKSGPKVLKIE